MSPLWSFEGQTMSPPLPTKSFNPVKNKFLSVDSRNFLFFLIKVCYFKLIYFGGVLDEIRLGIEEWGYSRSQQRGLNIILRFLKEVKDTDLSGKLQRIIDSLGKPQHG